jgi:hypothetical protein
VKSVSISIFRKDNCYILLDMGISLFLCTVIVVKILSSKVIGIYRY